MSRVDEALRRYAGGRGPLVPPLEAQPTPFLPQGQGQVIQLRELPQDAQNDWLDLREMLRILWIRRWEIVAVAVLVVLPVAVYVATAERLYRSTTVIQIDPEPAQVLPFREITLPSLTPNYEMFMRSQEQIFRGSALGARVIDQLRAQNDPVLFAEIDKIWWAFGLQRLENTQLFRLGYVATDPDVAAKVANIYADEYIKLNFDSRQEQRMRARALLERELKNMEQQLEESESKLVAYAQANGIPSDAKSNDVASQRLSSLSSRVTEAQSQVFVARVRAESIQRASVAEFPATLSNSTIVGLETRVLQIEQDLTTLRGTFGENWPAVVQRRSDLALAHDQLRREKESALARAREQAAIDLKTAEDRRELEATSLKGQEGVVHQIEAASVEYNIVLREVETNKKQYERLLERVQQTSVTSGMEFAGIHVIEPAMPSSEVYSPRVRWLLSLASLLGVGLGVCVAFGRSYWDQSLRSVEDVEHSVALPMLGVVPVVRKAKAVGTRSSGKLLREARSDAASGLSILGADAEPRLADASDKFTEGVRTVCASLLLSRSGRPPRVLLVTSTAGGEGKSTLAFELACMLAQSGARTLLVDCDLRRPRLHRALGLDNEKGLSLFLSGHLGKVAPVRDVADNLFAVTAGPESPNPPALLGSDGMRRFLGQMTETHQFVILDSPPLMPVADARVLATLVEGVVFVIRAGVAPKSLVRRSRAMLEAIGAPVLGAVLNGADPDHSHLGYGYESYGHSN